MKPSLINISEEFKVQILYQIRSDKIGELCQTDPTILTIGMRLFDKVKRKVDKSMEVRRSVQKDMRRLASLYLEFKELPGVCIVNGNAMDLFTRGNFGHQRDAIDSYTTNSENKLKPGLKIGLNYLIKTCAKIMKGTILTISFNGNSSKEDNKIAVDMANEIDLFLSVFNLWQDHIFGDAAYSNNKERQMKLQKPASLPLEGDIRKLRDHVIMRKREIVHDKLTFFDEHLYVELRNAACTRLTLLNGRRGGEVI